MKFTIDYNKIVLWNIPEDLRQQPNVAWLQALLFSLKLLHARFAKFIIATDFEIKITGQVCKLRYGLNEKFDASQRRFIIRDTPAVSQVYTFLQVENKPKYLPFFISGGGSDFEVLVPVDLRSQEVGIRSFLNRYKLPGKRYKIIYV